MAALGRVGEGAVDHAGSARDKYEVIAVGQLNNRLNFLGGAREHNTVRAHTYAKLRALHATICGPLYAGIRLAKNGIGRHVAFAHHILQCFKCYF